jgi:hypothetical protein
MFKFKAYNRRALALLLCTLMILTPAASVRGDSLDQPGRVHSTVTVAGTGEPVSGATISLINVTTAETVAREVTSDEGTVSFPDLPLGTYQLTLRAPGAFLGVASPLFHLDEESPSAEVAIELQDVSEHDEIRMAAGGILPWILIGLAAAGVAAIVIQQTEDGTG